jgi:hypothetical protein
MQTLKDCIVNICVVRVGPFISIVLFTSLDHLKDGRLTDIRLLTMAWCLVKHRDNFTFACTGLDSQQWRCDL